ncbi:hypothetical protein Y032_0017g3262 [Ancylostoma ceylanicum]|uniref:Uncharacterized protein n=1 Tax=Ancylostoma ceylanicum TaxID=53326 RepID=A0A016V5J9_9BILA|nr:hypothetical protein Y032_0017g3262 [Ancylostoma ceylanicum]
MSTTNWCLGCVPVFIPVSKWPANSPDLNFLDFLIWATLEQKACHENHTSVQNLRKYLEKAWNESCKDHVRAAVDPKRLKAVISAKGGYIERPLGIGLFRCSPSSFITQAYANMDFAID